MKNDSSALLTQESEGDQLKAGPPTIPWEEDSVSNEGHKVMPSPSGPTQQIVKGKYTLESLNIGNIQLMGGDAGTNTGGIGGELFPVYLPRATLQPPSPSRKGSAGKAPRSGARTDTTFDSRDVKQHPSKPMPKCPEPGNGVHSWIMKAAWWCRHSGLALVDAEVAISKAMSRSARPNEIMEALCNAYSADTGVNIAPAIQAEFEPEKLKAIAAKVGAFTEGDIARKSPISPSQCSPGGFLRALYKIGERVVILTDFRDQFPEVWEHQEGDDNDLYQYRQPQKGLGVWFLSNPVTGKIMKVPRLVTEKNPEGKTMRASEAVTDFRYMLVESDEAPSNLWLSAIVQVPLPIVSLVTSGGKSIHALIRVDAESEEEFNMIKAQIGPSLVKMGACKNSLTPVRLTRLPGCYRAEKSAWQELLYLNPDADGTPIAAMRDLRPQMRVCAFASEETNSNES